jgi:nucleotide-binding universal stress UspA family protein
LVVFKSIVVGFDRSEHARAAFTEAVDIARTQKSPLTVLVAYRTYVSVAIVVNEPAAALLGTAASSSGPVLAMRTPGVGPVKRFVPGCTSTTLLRAGHSPLLIVPGRAVRAQTSTCAA